ncbi:MAG: NYN domain-containing protein, partial [Planctomycetota bacterium]
IAVFIDFDNIEIGVKSTLHREFDVAAVLDALKERGEIVTKFAYANWGRQESATRALSGGKFTMDYILARYGFSRAGGCQTYSVGGWDPAPVAAPKGDRWYLRFFVVPGQDIETQAASANFAPPTAPQTLFGVSSITVEIGDFSQQMQMKKGPHWLSFRGTHTANGVYQATFDSRTLHARVQTNIILTDDSNIPAAITTKNLIIFPLAVSFTGFSGETGRIIAPNRYAWKQR